MTRATLFVTSALVSAAWLSLPSVASAADTAPASNTVGELVVTGSLIQGTAKDTALPVEVITASQMQLQGVPNFHDLARNDPAMGPIMGEENQWSGNVYMSAGPVSASRENLHGLGPLRTLTLFNGERLTSANYVDINLLPMTAVGRVEVLKDGASATYGSDAVAGVVNFITRTDLNGLEVQGGYRVVPGADGEYRVSASWGWSGETSNVLLSFGYTRKGVLPALARSWAVQPITKNPTPWDAYQTPGQYDVQTPSGRVRLADGSAVNSCTNLGGTLSYGFYQSPAALPGCNWNYLWDEYLVNPEDQYQAYAEINTQITPRAKFHFEALYGEDDTIRATSPAFYPSNGPTGPNTAFTVPAANPGFNTFLQQSGGAGLIGTATGAVLVGGANFPLWQPFGLGENPFTGGGNTNLFRSRFFRVSAGVQGDLGAFDIHYKITGTYSHMDYLASGDQPNGLGFDILVYNLQRALNGFGGPNCTGTTPGANGCQWFNPFANAIAKNPHTGQTNPGYVSATANNDPNLLRWLWGRGDNPDYVTDYGVVDAVVNGGSRIHLPGGEVLWAAGAQVRLSRFNLSTPDGGNVNSHPCPTPGDTTCNPQVGPYLFLGAVNPVQASDVVWSVFGQLQLPLTDRLKGQLSARYEDYGGGTGGALSPQFSAKWQVIDPFAIRATVGSSFRGPLSIERAQTGATTVQSINVTGGAYRAIDNIGNPNVGPEKGFNVGVGGILKLGDFQATLDYWYYRLRHQIVRPDANLIATQAVPTPIAGGLGVVDCSSAAAKLLIFTGNTCVQGVTLGRDIQRIEDQVVNGPPVTTDGLDFDVSYSNGDILGGRFTADLAATYLLRYDVDQFKLGALLVSAAYDGAGKGNFNRLPGPLPRFKGALTFNYTKGISTVSLTERYSTGYFDDRTGLTSCVTVTPGVCSPLNYNHNIAPFYTTDLSYQANLPHSLQVTISLLNLFDRTPSFIQNAPGYDPSTGDPYGRTVQFTVKKKF